MFFCEQSSAIVMALCNMHKARNMQKVNASTVLMEVRNENNKKSTELNKPRLILHIQLRIIYC